VYTIWLHGGGVYELATSHSNTRNKRSLEAAEIPMDAAGANVEKDLRGIINFLMTSAKIGKKLYSNFEGARLNGLSFPCPRASVPRTVAQHCSMRLFDDRSPVLSWANGTPTTRRGTR